MRFDENPFTSQREEEDKKAEAFQISHFYGCFRPHGGDGVKRRDIKQSVYIFPPTTGKTGHSISETQHADTTPSTCITPPSIAWRRREAWKEEALDNLPWKDERGPSYIRRTNKCIPPTPHRPPLSPPQPPNHHHPASSFSLLSPLPTKSLDDLPSLKGRERVIVHQTNKETYPTPPRHIPPPPPPPTPNHHHPASSFFSPTPTYNEIARRSSLKGRETAIVHQTNKQRYPTLPRPTPLPTSLPPAAPTSQSLIRLL